MRVNNSSLGANKTSIPSTAVKPRETSPRHPEPQFRSGSFDHVALSRFSQVLSGADDVRLEKLRAAVGSGTYSVSRRDVGSSIIEEHIANAGNGS
jgi:anti-sigma28 factor (negative regulator of flagellin synthesis)